MAYQRLLNIKLVGLYSKSVSRENSNCVAFVRVRVKHIVQNRLFFLMPKGMKKGVIFDPGGTLNVEVIGMLIGNFLENPKYTEILILSP